jgi:L-2,4-diaminobutyrate decarboxylase
MGFSSKLRQKIKGIEQFDSVTTDPHKVMVTPYVISALLVKDPSKMKTITSKSDLIMQEQFAFGQVTPFLGSKAWNSLKLWFVMKNLGKTGLGKMIEHRHSLAKYLETKLRKDKDFKVLNKVQINSVAFMYTKDIPRDNLEMLNQVNKKIHDTILERGDFHLHQFSVPDSGIFQKDFLLFPLRYMSGNPNLTERDIDRMVEYVRKIGKEIVKG